MFFFTRHELEQYLVEDMPYHDLSAEAIDASGTARIDYVTREPGVACGAEEVRQLADTLGLVTQRAVPSASPIETGQTLFSATGETQAVFALWKVGQNLLDRGSGIATAARRWRNTLDEAGFDLPVLITRKTMPGAKKLLTKAAVAGGAVPHRLGLSETLLFFDQHVEVAGGEHAFLQRLPHIRRRHVEKKIIVETADVEFAGAVLGAGADGIQFDKVPADELTSCVDVLRAGFDHPVLLAAGGVSLRNCVQYAAAGVDGLVTSAVYQAPPLDIGVRIIRT